MSEINIQNIETQNKYQKLLYGYDFLFKNLVALYKKNKLPNKIIFNGNDGIGKATFVYHLINVILSNNENASYDISAKQIKENNKSYLDLVNNSNFNFKHLKVDDYKKIISIEEDMAFSRLYKINEEREIKKVIWITNLDSSELTTFFFLNKNN